ncbi:MAG: hypothetical protein ACI4WT_03205 [Oligosphaeraceae bacterium]
MPTSTAIPAADLLPLLEEFAVLSPTHQAAFLCCVRARAITRRSDDTLRLAAALGCCRRTACRAIAAIRRHRHLRRAVVWQGFPPPDSPATGCEPAE